MPVSEAARKLRRSPPAVTRLLHSLEKRIGVRLLERSTRGVMATEAGLKLAAQARRVLAEYDAAVREDANGPLRGRLRVTAPMIFGRRHFAPIVTDFLSRYPGVQADLVLSDSHADLIDDGIDVALRIGPLADSRLVARRVGEVQLMLVGSPAYLRRRGVPAAPKDLAAHDLIHLTSVDGAPAWHFRIGGREQVIRFTPRLQINDVETMLNAAKGGHGIARVLSYQVAAEVRNGVLVRLLAECEPPAWPVHLVMPSARYMPPKLRAFLDHAAAALADIEVLRPW